MKMQYLIIFSILLASCSNKEVTRITIDKSKYGTYNAVILDLHTNELIQINDDLRSLEEIKGDIWIEPRDPEIAGLEKSFEGVKLYRTEC